MHYLGLNLTRNISEVTQSPNQVLRIVGTVQKRLLNCNVSACTLLLLSHIQRARFYMDNLSVPDHRIGSHNLIKKSELSSLSCDISQLFELYVVYR